MPQAQQDSTQSDSSTDNDLKVAPATDQVEQEQQTPPTPQTPPTSASTEKEAPVDPVADAIARLRSDSGDDDEPEKASPPADKQEPTESATSSKEQPKQPEKSKDPESQDATKPQDQSKPAKEQPPADDPLKDWSREERIHTKGKVKERYRALHEQFRTASAERDSLKKDADIGKAFKNIGQTYQVSADFDALEDEHIAWAVKVQAASVRALQAVRAGKTPAAADLEAVRLLQQGSLDVAKTLGLVKPAAPASPAAPTMDAETEAMLKEAEEYGVDTSKVRAKFAKAQPVQQPTQQPTQQSQSPSEDWRIPAVKKLVQLGVQQSDLATYYDTALKPVMSHLLRTEYADQEPDAAFNALSNRERVALVMEAHAAIVTHRQRQRSQPSEEAAPAVPVPQPRKQPPANKSTHAPLSTSSGRAPGASPRQSSGDPVRDAIAFLRND